MSRWFVVTVSVLVVGSIYLFNLASPIDIYRRLLAMAIIWLGVTPTLIYLLNRQRPPIPFFPLVGLFYASNFGLPIFFADSRSNASEGTFRIEDVSAANLWMTIAGLLCLIAAFYTGQFLFGKRIKPVRISGDWHSAKFQIVLWICTGTYFLYQIVPVLKHVPSLGSVVTPLVYLVFGSFFFLTLQGRLPFPLVVIIWLVLLPIEVILRFSSGALAGVMILGLFFSLISLRAAPKLAVGSFAMALLVFVIFNPVKADFRAMTWYIGENENESGVNTAYAKGALLIRLAYEYHLGSRHISEPQLNEGEALASVASRTSSVSMLAVVMGDTPDRVPYWGGISYLPLFSKIVPRALWPDKPVEDMGNEFGHRYFLIADYDMLTSINLPWIVEMYANFGAWGVYVGMTLVGSGLAILDRLFNRRECNPIELIFGATLLLQIIYQESSFSLMAGQALLLFVSLRLALYFGLAASRRSDV